MNLEKELQERIKDANRTEDSLIERAHEIANKILECKSAEDLAFLNPTALLSSIVRDATVVYRENYLLNRFLKKLNEENSNR